MNTKTAFIIQARLGSTRLPGKIMIPFANGRSLIELLISKLSTFSEIETIIATSKEKINEPLIEFLDKKNIKYYAGSENDVLSRFIEAATKYNITNIIRICSDNLFLELESINQLLQISKESPADYISFNVNGIPSIKTHFGFWTEFVKLDALKKVAELTTDSFYREHVTNYIYTHANSFNILWVNVDKEIAKRNDIRLTIDTPNDFETVKYIYSKIGDRKSINEIIHFIDSNNDLINSMKKQIIINSK